MEPINVLGGLSHRVHHHMESIEKALWIEFYQEPVILSGSKKVAKYYLKMRSVWFHMEPIYCFMNIFGSMHTTGS